MAQTGGWRPPNADTSYPRSIIHNWEIPVVKLSLAQGQNISVYTNLYNNAMSNPPAGNTQIDERASRSAIAKNCAYVYMLGVKPNGNSTTQLTPTEKDNLKTKSITLIQQLNNYVNPMSLDSPLNFDFWQYISKDMIKYIEAYDFLKGGGATDVELAGAKLTLKVFVGNLYYNSTLGIGGANFFQTAKNNHALMSAGALGLAAVVLSDIPDTLTKYNPQNWIDCAMWNIHNVLWWDIRKLSSVKSSAGDAEGTYYFKYAFCNLLPFFKAMGNFLPDTTMYYNFYFPRKIRNPWYDTNYIKIYDWFASVKLPDGRMPAIEDSYVYMTFPELAILRNPKYLWPLHLSQLDSLQSPSFNEQVTAVYDMRADYISANMLPQEPIDSSFIALPDAGVAVFRSGNDSTSTYLALLGKHGNALSSAESHNQADDASFTMMVNGQNMALDPGYVFYLLRDSVANAKAHNTILVDGVGTDIGYPGVANGANCFIEKYFKSPVQNYAEVRTNYLATDINRKVLHVRNKYFLLVDHMMSPTPHQYSMLIHGYGGIGIDTISNGKFIDMTTNNRAAWKRKNSGLFAYTNSDTTFSITKKLGTHEHAYFILQHHIYTSANSIYTTGMSYMTCLQPFKNLATDTFPVITLNVSEALGYKVVDANNIDLAVTKSFTNSIDINKTITGINNSYNTDAQFFWTSENAGNVSDLFVYKATSLIKNGDTLLTADKPYNIQYLTPGPKTITGFSGDSGYVHFHTSEYPYQVLGEGVWTTSYDSINKIETVFFGKSTSFTINMDDTKLGMNEVKMLPNMHLYPNPASQEVTVSFNEFTSPNSVIEIYDITGKLVQSTHLKWNTKEIVLPISQLESGIYFVNLRSSDNVHTKSLKLIKQD